MNFIKRNIPNTITCGNLLCGCLAIVKAFEGDLVWAAYLVGIAAVLDFFDGFAARALKVSSPIGKDLDSLADMVTFGVVPGVVMYQLLTYQCSMWNAASQMNTFLPSEFHSFDKGYYSWLAYLAFLIPIFSAIRLAKFNNDTRQSDSFIGLPTPANAIFICSLALLVFWDMPQNGMTFYPPLSELPNGEDLALHVWQNKFYELTNPILLVSITIVMSTLLITPLPLFSLKFKSFGWKGNEIRFIFLILSVALIGFLQFVGIPLVIVLYILMSIINNFIGRAAK